MPTHVGMFRPSARTEGRRTPRWRFPALLLFALLTCLAGSAGGASAPVVVTMDVPSASSLTNNCRQAAGYRFGTVQPGTPALTATATGACSFSFDSTNDTAMLRMYQRDQNVTPAMASMSSTMIDQDGGQGYNTFFDLDMFDATTGYTGGNTGVLAKTTDGSTWGNVGAYAGMTIRGVEAVTASTVVVVGSSGIRRSTDSGSSWTTVYAPAGIVFHDIDRAGGTFWAVGSGGHVATSGDGLTWTPQTSGTTYTLESIDAVTATVALAAGGGRVLRYDGASWTTRFVGDAGYEVSAWSSTGLAIAAGNWGEVRRSLDGGVTWGTSTFGPSPGWNDMGIVLRAAVVVSATEAYVGGTRGAILKTGDSGATWTEPTTPTANTIRGMAANPAGTRWWAVGGGELVADTGDWSSWSVRRRNVAALMDVTALDAQNAYAVGAHGSIRVTSDGTTWSSPASPTSEHLWAVDAVSGGVGYAVGDNGTVLRTTNGATWTAVTATGSQSLRGVAVIDADTVIAVGLGGIVARSTDAGSTWTITTPVAATLSSISAHDRRIVAVGGAGTILVSFDRGLTWTNRTAVSGTTNMLRDVSVASEDVIYAISKYENLSRKSTDGGATWQLWQGINWGNGGYSVSAISENVVFTTIYDTWTTRSTDGGASASTLYFQNGQFNWAVAAVDANTAWIVGEDGAISKSQQAATINDYGGANTWGNATTPSLFGVCLQSVTGATSDWAVDASPPCTASDGDPWQALPASTVGAKVAHTTSAGASASVTVVWGVRPDENTPPGDYHATALVEVLAPNA